MKKTSLLILFFLLLFFPKEVAAVKEFRQDHIISYKLDLDGNATVEQKITLTNNFSNIYPQEYYLETTLKPINITAWDQKGSILNGVEEKNGGQVIKLKFKEESVGKEKTTVFNVKYTLPKFATQKGRVWEIVVPQQTTAEEIDSLAFGLLVPVQYGQLAYATGKIETNENLGTHTRLTLSKSELSQKSVAILFGDFQNYSFSLVYHLVNSSSDTVKTEIPLPPQTNYQEIRFSSIDPSPESVKEDNSGNWMATYLVPPASNLSINVKGQGRVFSSPQKADFYNQENKLALFLGKDKYWETGEEKIAKLAADLKTVNKIYQFVVSSLSYDYDSVANANPKRKGAINALAEPGKNVCSEFTDLFVTLCRAVGIPAREIEGYAYTTNPKLKPVFSNKDILHSWPEYWNQKTGNWVQVDPTWEKTTGGVDYFRNFDFNHIAFVIHGEDSEKPFPPGSYVDISNSSEKSVIVDFATQLLPEISLENALANLQISFSPKDESSTTSFLGERKVTLVNRNLFPLKSLAVTTTIAWGKLSKIIASPKEQEIPLLPPLGNAVLEIKMPYFWQTWIFNPKMTTQVTVDNGAAINTLSTRVLSNKEAGIRVLVFSALSLTVISLFVFLVIKKYVFVEKNRHFC